MANALNAELLLVHILDATAYDSPKQPMVLVSSFSQDADNSAQTKYETQWEQYADRYGSLLKQKQSEAKAAGVTATHLQTHGTTARKICELAKMNNIDLIVLGSRDRTDKNSISGYLVHHAPCSVTVEHPKAQQTPAAEAERLAAVTV